MAQPENEISIIHGTLEEFANGFAIRQSAQTESTPDNTLPRIYHGSQKIPYERVRNFLHQEAEIWVTDDHRIVNIELIKSSENNGSTSKPKTFLQSLIQLFTR